jgi:3-hydroxyisobutyrate dehydrogenase
MARVAFIGLGNMGSGMAANLAQKGHEVHAFDLSADAMARAASAGCRRTESARVAIAGAEAIITMLPAGTHVESLYTEAVFGNAPSTAVLIDCSTIDVATAKRIAEAAHAQGFLAVDAPVSGGIGAANAGTLTFMVGASEDAFARAEPFLADMGKTVIHAGASGAGQAAKICNNMLLGVTMAGTCEAFRLAENLGLDPRKFFDIASVSSGQSWSMTSYCPVPGVGPDTPADRGYKGGFAAALMLKDLRLAIAAAEDSGTGTPMGARARELYEELADQGQGTSDFSVLFKSGQKS